MGTGAVPWGLIPMPARDIGLPKAKELVMLCDPLPAVSALELGLVNRVVPDEAALDEAVEDVRGAELWFLHRTHVSCQVACNNVPATPPLSSPIVRD